MNILEEQDRAIARLENLLTLRAKEVEDLEAQAGQKDAKIQALRATLRGIGFDVKKVQHSEGLLPIEAFRLGREIREAIVARMKEEAAFRRRWSAVAWVKSYLGNSGL